MFIVITIVYFRNYMKLINSIAFVLIMLISVACITATEFSKETQKILERIRKNGTQEEKSLAVKLVKDVIDEAFFKIRMNFEMKYATSMFDEGVKAHDGKQMEKWGREYHRLYLIDSDEIGTTPADVLVCQKGNFYKKNPDVYVFNLLFVADGRLVEYEDKTFINIKEVPEYLYKHIANCFDENKCREMLRAAEKLGFDFSEKRVSYWKALALIKSSSNGKIAWARFHKDLNESPQVMGYEALMEIHLNPTWFSTPPSPYPYKYKNGEAISAMDFAVIAKNIPMIQILDKEYGVKLRAKHLDRAYSYLWWKNQDKKDKGFLPELLKLCSKNNKNLAITLIKNENDAFNNSEALIKIYLDQKKEVIKIDKLKQLEEVAINRVEHDCEIGECGEMLRGLKSDEEIAKVRNSKRCKDAKKIHTLLLEHVKQAEYAEKQFV